MRIVLLLLSASLVCAQEYDLLLKGGHVIDPKNKISGRRDVAIKDGRIAAVAAEIPAAKALKIVNVAGMYVTPGLVDLHVHVFAGTGTAYTGPSSVRPDDHSFRSGVTTMVDAGSSGWRNFEDFKKLIIEPARTRVLAMLNIVGAGMAGDPEQNLQDMDPGKAADMAAKHRQIIVGFKTAHYAGPEWTPVENAVKAGDTAGLPVMVDFGRFRPERPFEDLVTKKLRPGDIYTHTFLSMVPMLDDGGRLRPYLAAARKRGVLFDVGHGGGSFLFRQAVPAIQQGFMPDSISTDLHIGSMNGAMATILTTLSKFINMGMTLDDVILRTTWNPARQIKREGGTGTLVRGRARGHRRTAPGKGLLRIYRRKWRAHAGNTKVGMRTDHEQRESCMGPQRDNQKRLEDAGPLRSSRRPAVGRDCPAGKPDEKVRKTAS